MTWRAIADAPKGKWILAAWDGGSEHSDWLPSVMCYMRGMWIDESFTSLPTPTHWMPLPDPPKEES